MIHQTVTFYVVGFMFSKDLSQVALIRKEKPDWQKGKLNGIGGKREYGERSIDAMVREFYEEAGCPTSVHQWRRFCEMGGGNDGSEGLFHIDFFAALGNPTALVSQEQEKIEVVLTRDIHPLRKDTIENLPWLISLAVDFITDGRPDVVRAYYPVEIKEETHV